MPHSDSFITKKDALKQKIIKFLQNKPPCKMEEIKKADIIHNRKYLRSHLDELVSEKKIWFDKRLRVYGSISISEKNIHGYLVKSIPLELEERFKQFKEICPDGKTIQVKDCDKEYDNFEISMEGVLRKLYCYFKLREKILHVEKEIIQNSNGSELAIEWYEKVYTDILSGLMYQLGYIKQNTGLVLLSRLRRLTIQYANLLWDDGLYIYNYKNGAYTFGDLLKILMVYFEDGIKEASAIHMILSNVSRERGQSITLKEIEESRMLLNRKFPKHLRKTKDLLAKVLDSNGKVDHDKFIRMYNAYLGKPYTALSVGEMKLVYKLVDKQTAKIIKMKDIPVKDKELINLPSFGTSPFF
jgi:hypothetical protein